jgi:succinate-acetate transporter protein
LSLAFFLLAAGVQNEDVDRAGGWAGMIAAGLAFWLASLEIINDVAGGK